MREGLIFLFSVRESEYSKREKTMTEKSRVRPPTSPITDALADLRATSLWQERVYKRLHARPELSFQETETAALAASKLKEFGYEVIEGVGRTGVVGLLRNGAGRVVLARADMDALPVRENTGLPSASTLTATDSDGQAVDVAHACGHGAHVTCLLGAAELLARARGSCGGTFIALFQPADEFAGHESVNHKRGEYVRGAAYVNTCESFHALLKRGAHDVYHHWSPKHLHRYAGILELGATPAELKK